MSCVGEVNASPRACVKQFSMDVALTLHQAVWRRWKMLRRLICFNASGRLVSGLSRIILVSSLREFIFVFWMIPWSSGCIFDVVFLGRKRVVIWPSWLTRVSAGGWAGQLPRSRTAPGSSPWWWRCFLTSGTNVDWNQVSKIAPVIQALREWVCCTGRVSRLTWGRHRGFLKQPTTRGFNLCVPVSLVVSRRVTRFLLCLKPSALVVELATARDLLGCRR